jgi:hypothetical protein
MELKEQNWQNLCANHVKDWHGIWTRYSPQGDMMGSFQSLRRFHGTPDCNEVIQTNRYIYTDGRIEEQSWTLNQQLDSFPDGLSHPAFPSMRTLFFEQGAAALLCKQLETGKPSAFELFFRHDNLRNSIGIVYDAYGSLMRTASIREDTAGFPSQYWTTEVNLGTKRNLSGNWSGTAVTMTPDLKVSTPVPMQLRTDWEGHETFFYPDGITLNCPRQVKIGTAFTLAANWLVNSCELQHLIINYDESGAFSTLTLELFHQSAGENKD